jgi:TPR repeat protein
MANIEAKRKHLRNAEEKFMKFCRQRGNNTDSSTAFFRLGRCFEKGYGVDADIVQAYILYCKSLEQISIKHDVAFNTSVTIYHCR